jgi:hypothetical protein
MIEKYSNCIKMLLAIKVNRYLILLVREANKNKIGIQSTAVDVIRQPRSNE